MEIKKRYKLFKAGKKWCTVAIATTATLTGLAAMGENAAADTATPTTDQVTTNQPAADVTTTSASAAASQNNQQATATVDQNDHGNYAYMDRQTIDNQGQLVASGWHATNDSVGRSHHYIIAYDQTNKREIARQEVTGMANQVARPDVEKVHHVAGAAQSGFKVTFNLGKLVSNTSSIQLISRYSSDPAGNANYVDYWFTPLTVDHNNYAYLDKAAVVNGKLHLSGWHASNLAADKQYRYLIILDRTTGREVARQQIRQNVSRNDVARAFPAVENASQSGFSADFSLAGLNFNHQLQVLSRYSTAPDGNSGYLDYYFAPITSGNYQNQGYLDSFNLSNAKQVTVSGWHANDISQFAANHYLILYDNTANRQVAVTKAVANKRTDVGRAFSGIKTAVNAGFSGTFDLTNKLTAGHAYSLVSRYSTSAAGNGGSGSYSDYWYPIATLNQHQSYIDSLKMTAQGLQVKGWMASDYSASRPYAYAIVLNNGKEVNRQRLSLTSRQDVGRVYGHIYNSTQSGFNTLVKFDPAAVTGNMQVLLRFTDDPAGNGHYDDQLSKTYGSNEGWFDQASFDGKQVHVSGWHASNLSASKKYHWIIAVDQNGSELGRWRVQNANLERPDLAQKVGYIFNSEHSGFNLSFTVNNSMQHKVIRLIDRLTDDANGNGHYVDLTSNGVSINSGAQTSGLKTLYYDAMGGIVGAFNNAEVICQNPELPTGCEMTAVTMMLRYAGCNVNKFQVANETPRSSNGNYGFVGNPYSTSGWWVFPTGIAPVVQRHLGTSQVMTGCSLQAIKDKLNLGHLVVVWMANMNGFVNHAITLTGYNGGGFTYNNPWTGRKESMSYGEFYGHWNADAQRALSY